MNPESLLKEANTAKESGAHCGMTLVFPHNSKRPKGFPRGEFLSETERGKVYSFSPDKIIKWLTDNNLKGK